MNISRMLSITSALSFLALGAAGAQTATQTVNFQVAAVNQIAVTGSPTLTINSATAGTDLSAATSIGNTWAVTTNGSNMKVTASLASAMPSGLTLKATMAAPTGATSAGALALSATAVDLVTGISKLAQSGLSLSYELDASASAGVVASGSRVVTYTVTQGS